MRHDRDLTSLAQSLCRYIVPARPLLIVADALGLMPRRIMRFREKEFATVLRQLRTDQMDELYRAVAAMESATKAATAKPKSKGKDPLDDLAESVLDNPQRGSKLRLMEQAIVRRAVARCSGNQSAAARLLGVDRKALTRRLAKSLAQQASASAAAPRARRRI